MTIQEQWRKITIDGFENYSISSLGKVRRDSCTVVSKSGKVRTYETKLFSTRNRCFGYPICGMTNHKTGKSKSWRVHILVALMFIPNPENKKQVNHKDGNKVNNCVDNLEWMTPLENTHHAIATGLRKDHGEHSSQSRLTDAQVLEMRELHATREYYFKDLGEMFNVHPTTARKAVFGISWSHLK